MSPATIFQIHLVLGYVPWLLCFGAYVWPRLKAVDRVEAHRAIAMLHSFRFFGLVFLVPGVVGPGLPAGFHRLGKPLRRTTLRRHPNGETRYDRSAGRIELPHLSVWASSPIEARSQRLAGFPSWRRCQ